MADDLDGMVVFVAVAETSGFHAADITVTWPAGQRTTS